MTPRAYHVTFDQVSAEEWAALLPMFEDATIYQSLEYGVVRWGKKRLSHAVLTRADGTVCGMAQITLFPAPFGLPFGGVAYASYGPIVKRAGEPLDPQAIDVFLKALRDEYVMRRKGVLRLMPYAFQNNTPSTYIDTLVRNRFERVTNEKTERTVLIDLTKPTNIIRAKLSGAWRSHLSKAERQNLLILEGEEDRHFDLFSQLYLEMLNRKNFRPGAHFEDFASTQKKLPPALKMRVFIAVKDDIPINGLVVSRTGKTGNYLFGATSNHATTSTNGSYLLQWRAIEWLKDQGVSSYDLTGIDPSANPSVARFKLGILGTGNGAEYSFLGAYQTSNIPGLLTLLHSAEWMKRKIKNLKGP